MTPVVFRKGSLGVFALFPTVQHNGPYCTSFAAGEGHGAADYTYCIAQSKPAEPGEYKGLKLILEQSYGYTLSVRKRARVNFI